MAAGREGDAACVLVRPDLALILVTIPLFGLKKRLSTFAQPPSHDREQLRANREREALRGRRHDRPVAVLREDLLRGRGAE
jgi:hypothetical protein